VAIVTRLGLVAIAIVVGTPAAASADGLEVDVEVGAVLASRNDARIPGAGGTSFSLVDDLATSAAPVFRLRAGYRLGDRHLVTALYAPLQLNARGSLDRELAFAGGTYPAGTPLLAVYRFDSYRLTYRYSFVRRPDLEIAAGVTAKIRDAEISVYGAEARRKTNTGLVPLANLHIAWRPDGGRFGVVLEADALAAPQGRAEDVLIAATWAVRDDLGLRLGYRTVEGGADNDEVYNFAWLHYAVAGIDLRF
jgi:hypothetical protein